MMGQGYSLTSAPAGPGSFNIPELAKFTFEKSLGNARFMKSARGHYYGTSVVVKVVMKPNESYKFVERVKAILDERKRLMDVPNVITWFRIIETASSGYLIRQYLYSSLYDRMSTRPFLETIEKKWFIFQLLCALRNCHAQNVYHGDLKTQNILVTSWHWLYLTDFSSEFKPTYLPEDNPADFSFYFDTCGRRVCYLAPERFLDSTLSHEGLAGINWAMDIFSAGCVIAELLLETPIFNLHQLFKYRRGEYDVKATVLTNIEDDNVRELVEHMIQLDPCLRYSADEYLKMWRGKIFPDYFYSFLHEYMHLITEPNFGGRSGKAGGEEYGESDVRIEHVFNDFDKISYFLGYEDSNVNIDLTDINAYEDSDLNESLYLSLPNNRRLVCANNEVKEDDGTLIFLSVVLSSVRNTLRSASRLQACELMLAFAKWVTDDAKLDRILPYAMCLIDDPSDLVKVTVIRLVTHLTKMTKVVSPINAHIFLDYILPRMQPLVYGHASQPSVFVRSVYASCISSLAVTALRFLDAAITVNEGGGQTLTWEGGHRTGFVYDRARSELVAEFESHTKSILCDRDSTVRRSFLKSAGTLCAVFGSNKANDVILSHLNTYLNDEDWMLKCSFFEKIVGVGVYVGTANLEEFILPLMIQALTDPEEFVIEKILRSFGQLASLGMFQKSTGFRLIEIVCPFTMHPNLWIREACANFISQVSKYMSKADCHVIITPLIKPYVRVVPSEFTQVKLIEALKEPLPRIVLDIAVSWVWKLDKGDGFKADKCEFWKSAQSREMEPFDAVNEIVRNLSGKDVETSALSKVAVSKEDEVWIARLRKAGLTPENELKLLCLRQYIWRMGRRRIKSERDKSEMESGSTMALKDLNVDIQTIFFEAKPRELKGWRGNSGGSRRSSRAWTSRRNSDATSYLKAHPTKEVERNEKQDSKEEKAMGTSSESPGKGTCSLVLVSHGDDNRLRPVTHISSSSAILRDQESVIDDREIEENTRIEHSYAGNDPTVHRLLNKICCEQSTLLNDGLGEFGPMTNSYNGWAFVGRGGKDVWKPEGIHIATLDEHTCMINGIAVSPDSTFFVTVDDEGNVKVWDIIRLERKVSRKSKSTFSFGAGVKVTFVDFIDRTRSFVCAGSDGNILVMKVETVINPESGSNCGVRVEWNNSAASRRQPGSGAPCLKRLGKLRILKQFHLDRSDEYAMCGESFIWQNQAFLLCATNKSRILCIKLSNMTIHYILENPAKFGVPTNLCIDRNRNWLLVVTSHGILSLWDLRFKLRVKSSMFPGAFPINQVEILPGVGRGSSRRNCVILVGGTGHQDITVWDIHTNVCREMYLTFKEKPPKVYQLIDVEKMDAREFRDVILANTLDKNYSTCLDQSITSFTTGTHHVLGNYRDVNVKQQQQQSYFIISAGPGSLLRFWDINHTRNCMLISGFINGFPLLSYHTPQVTADTIFLVEQTASGPVHSEGESESNKSVSPLQCMKSLPFKNSLLSAQNRLAARTHFDVITQVALLIYPYPMIISSDRTGLIQVYA